MYRAFLFLAFVAYCSSAPFASSIIQKSAANDENDLNDIVDTNGSGYSYFIKQNIDTQPSVQSSLEDLPDQDLSVYSQASALDERPTRISSQILNNAYGPQKSSSRLNSPRRNQRPKFNQNDSPRLPSAMANKYSSQSEPSGANIFGNQRRTGYKQPAFPQSNSNVEQQMFRNFDPYHPIRSSSAQQKSPGLNSLYGGKGQPPVSSSFQIQSQQQNGQAPNANALFLSSQRQRQPQRFTSKQYNPWE